MNACAECRDLLPEYLEGTLGADSGAAVARHLASCPECRGEEEFARALTAAARRLPCPEPRDETALRILERLEPSPRRAPRSDFGPVLDVEELADFLHVDAAALEPYLPDIPCFELAGRLLYRRQTVEEWIRQRERSFGFPLGSLERGRWGVAEMTREGGVPWTL